MWKFLQSLFIIIFVLSYQYLCIMNSGICNLTVVEEDEYGSSNGLVLTSLKQYSNSYNVKNRYQLMLMPSDNSIISISQNGVLHWRRNSDREQLCKLSELSQSCVCNSNEMCKIHLQIWIKKLDKLHEPPLRLPITICVKDIDDNAPQIPVSIEKEIPENTRAPYWISLPIPNDIDSPQFSKHTYELTCDSNTNFISLNISEKIPSKYTPNLVISKSLDHEAKSHYSCKWKVCDTKQCSSSNLILKVLDQNDHAPQWQMSSWKVNLKENSPVNSVVAELHAKDMDSTFNDLSFSLIDDSMQHYFSVETKSGIVRLAGYLDYENLPQKVMLIGVQVTDNGIPRPLTATGTLTVSILDENDKSPRVELEKSSVSIKENVASQYLVYMTISDEDTGLNGQVNCDIVSPRDKFSLKQSSTKVYDIFSKTSFDREFQSRETVKIRCQDLGSPPRSTEVFLTVNIIDEDDNDVKFDKKTFVVGVIEENELGLLITQLKAHDKDSSSSIEYYLINKSDSRLIELDPHSGVVRSNRVFDREVQAEYQIKVGVRETRNNNKTDTAILILKILDINDNDPRFPNSYSFSVSENLEINSEIGLVEAIDPDSGVNGSIIYSQNKLGQRLHKPVLFFVDRNGKIRLFQKLDYEKRAVHNLVVYAQDQGSDIRRTGSTTVIISVTDENDNPPRFQKRFVTHKIDCSGRILTSTICEVDDKDKEVRNRQMEYQLLSISPNNNNNNVNRVMEKVIQKYHYMDNQTGEIFINIPENECFKLGRNSFKLKMLVRDPTNVQFKDECTISVTIISSLINHAVDKENGGGSSYGGNKGSRDKMNPYESGGSNNQRYKYNDKSRSNSIGGGSGNGRNNKSNGSEAEFDSSIFLIIILIALSLLLVVLLTCVAFMAKKCRNDQTDVDGLSKIETDLTTQQNCHSVDKYNHYSLQKGPPNSVPNNTFSFPPPRSSQFQMIPNQLQQQHQQQVVPDTSMTINSFLSDSSCIKSNLLNTILAPPNDLDSSTECTPPPSNYQLHSSTALQHHHDYQPLHNSSPPPPTKTSFMSTATPASTASTTYRSKLPVVSTSFV